MKKTIGILSAIAAGLLGLSFLGTKKVEDYSDHIDKLTIAISGFDRKSIKFRAPNLLAKLNVTITNPTPEDFELDGYGVVKVTRFLIKDAQGNVAAETLINQESIAIVANGSTEIKDIEFQGNAIKLLSLLQDIAFVRTAIEIDVLGTKYVIEND